MHSKHFTKRQTLPRNHVLVSTGLDRQWYLNLKGSRVSSPWHGARAADAIYNRYPSPHQQCRPREFGLKIQFGTNDIAEVTTLEPIQFGRDIAKVATVWYNRDIAKVAT
jgi:hypothetical protein